MGFYWIKTNSIIKKIFSDYLWDIPNNENKIYLTFDDGPTPEITEWVLEQLKQHNAKATFFCIGQNIITEPSIFRKTIKMGHAIGNHTFNHLNGWKTAADKYTNNILLCENAISDQLSDMNYKTPRLFRPPYGKITPKQAKTVIKKGYKIIMWDVLSADFDTTISKEKCLQNIIANVKPGSIIVFHDSHKAFKNLEYALPKVLDFLDENNFVYDTIR